MSCWFKFIALLWRMLCAILSHVIHVHFNCVFMFMKYPLFLHLRERKAKLPLLFSSQSFLQRASQPLQTFSSTPWSFLSPCPPFFDKEDDPSRLQYYSWRPTIVLLHNIIIFSGLFSKPPTSNSLAPCLYPLWHAEQSFSPSQPRCHSGIFPWVVTLRAAPLAL